MFKDVKCDGLQTFLITFLMTTPETVLYNGSVVNPDSLPKGIHKGFGAFETIRVRKYGGQAKILGLALHAQRLISGAKELGISNAAITESNLLETTARLITSFDWSQSSDAVIRLIVLEDALIGRCAPWARRIPDEGARLVSHCGVRMMPHIKHCSTLPSELSMQHALIQKAHEALLIDKDQIVHECSWSNIFWIDARDVLHTPSSSMLPGITRALVLKHAAYDLEVRLDRSRLSEITSYAKEFFLTNSLHGVVPVIRLDDVSYPVGHNTEKIADRYESLLDEKNLTTVFNI